MLRAEEERVTPELKVVGLFAWPLYEIRFEGGPYLYSILISQQ